jgi:hypothetical protein
MSEVVRGPSRKYHGRTLAPEFCICPLQSQAQCLLSSPRDANTTADEAVCALIQAARRLMGSHISV